MIKKMISVFLTAALVLFAVPCITASAVTDEDLLGTVSAEFESNGDPGYISGGVGDPGGASYGAYQLASSFDTPHTFAIWCQKNGYSVGDKLVAAYKADGNKYGTNFNNAWKNAAKADSAGFLAAQKAYIKSTYYTPLVNSLKTNLNFDVNKYSIALKNAVWSRAVQMGVGGYSSGNGGIGLFKTAATVLPGGLLAATEPDIILAVYRECGRAVSNGKNPISAKGLGTRVTEIITQFSLTGKTLSHFYGSSSEVQAAVWYRLNVSELNTLLKMYTQKKLASSANNGTTTASSLNVRTGPGTEYDNIGSLGNGSKVLSVISEKSVKKELWYYVRGTATSGGTVYGWVHSSYVKFNAVTVKEMTGEVDGDSKVTNIDSLMVLQYSVNRISFSAVQKKNADVNADGKINVVDALNILQYSVGKIKNWA